MENLKSWKTTVFGIAIIIFTGYNFEKIDTTPFYVLISLGVSFLFLPDTLISVIKRVLTRKSKEV